MLKRVKFVADFHIHSKYSAATSKDMDLKHLARFASMKGLNLLGTGDILYYKWFNELKKELTDLGEGFYVYRDTNVYFVGEVEVATVFEYEGKVRKIHHVILTPNLEVAEQLREVFQRLGFSVDSDGRPVANISPEEMVEAALEVDSKILIFPAHAWTPWWSLFGSVNGVNKIEECYGNMSGKIYALETGLSSDPEMNWRVSALDRLLLLSNSDAHSPWPWRIGREANVFKLDSPSYLELYRAITQERWCLLYTIEVDPAYGKYHWSGHRKCGVGPLSPNEVRLLKGVCPVCKKKLTLGVEERVEELADRPKGFRPRGARPFFRLIPLAEIIAKYLGSKSLYSKRVWELYSSMIKAFGDELTILLNLPRQRLLEVDKKLADMILAVREGKVRVVPGYDGVYGKIVFGEEKEKEDRVLGKKQTTLFDYMKD